MSGTLIGFLGVILGSALGFWANAARLRQERLLSRVERLQAALDAAAERLMGIDVMENPYEDDLDRALNHLQGRLNAGRQRLRLWFEDDHEVVKKWDCAAGAIADVKRLWWKHERNDELEKKSNAKVLEWAPAARSEIKRQEDEIPSMARLLTFRK